LGDRAISKGISGKDVRELADLLIKIEYITEDILQKDNLGNVICCSNISNAIKKFQQNNNLVVDGIADKTTINTLKNHAANYTKPVTVDTTDLKKNLGDRILKKGMHGTDVTQLKNILIDKGYLSGSFAKGSILFDAEIEKAVIKFQQKTGIDTDGIVEVQTVYFLKK
jgi:peptidoglycan hydrolase-like protein with peptidoglycan-binding domain